MSQNTKPDDVMNNKPHRKESKIDKPDFLNSNQSRKVQSTAFAARKTRIASMISVEKILSTCVMGQRMIEKIGCL